MRFFFFCTNVFVISSSLVSFPLYQIVILCHIAQRIWQKDFVHCWDENVLDGMSNCLICLLYCREWACKGINWKPGTFHTGAQTYLETLRALTKRQYLTLWEWEQIVSWLVWSGWCSVVKGWHHILVSWSKQWLLPKCEPVCTHIIWIWLTVVGLFANVVRPLSIKMWSKPRPHRSY